MTMNVDPKNQSKGVIFILNTKKKHHPPMHSNILRETITKSHKNLYLILNSKLSFDNSYGVQRYVIP